MSQEVVFEENSRRSRLYTVNLSSLNNSSASVLHNEKDEGDGKEEVPYSRPECSKESVKGDHPQAQEDFPDGGLRAWLVVLGVRP
jgi:hypothetical protein